LLTGSINWRRTASWRRCRSQPRRAARCHTPCSIPTFIDRAQNNTSLCLLIEAAGKRLLLPGDAELESWDQIREHCGAQLTPVDFLKVSHHGSHNGTPLNLLDELLPRNRADRAKVLVSTKRNVYGTRNPVADAPLMAELGSRCAELVTTDGAPGTYADIQL
jgi:hypothetical protein